MRETLHVRDKKGDRAGVWRRAQDLYDTIPADRKAGVVSPAHLRHSLGAPAVYVHVLDKIPVGYFGIAVNPRAPRTQILAAVSNIIDDSTQTARRCRFTTSEIKQFVLWYYELAAGVKSLNELAVDEAQRARRRRATRRARRGTSVRALNQAKSRINAGRAWLLSQILPR